MGSCKIASLLLLFGGIGFSQAISFPSSPLTVAATSSSGTSFTYSGTLTQAATITFTASGTACEQGAAYCTNAAGVVVVAGSSPVGGASTFSTTFGSTSGAWDFGALIMVISGAGAVQVFPANIANGFDTGSPPTSLTLPATTLSSLGFGTFSVSNPTITFVNADNLYSDNSGGFTLSQTGSPVATPAPATLYLALGAIALLVVLFRRQLGSR